MSTTVNSRIVSLDGIRAVAALIVFAAHNGLENRIPGGFGVSIFFFLSGYLISTLLRMEFESNGSINLKNFYLRRIFRIFPPLYLVLLAFALPPLGHLSETTSGSAVAAQVFQLTNYVMALFGSQYLIPMTGCLWSLSVEEHFYLLFPFALRFLLRRYERGQIAAMLLAACAAVLVWRLVLVLGFGVPSSYTYVATDTRVDALLFGCVMAIGANPQLDHGALRLSTRTWIFILGASVVLLAFSLGYRNALFRETFRYTVQGIGLFAIFFCAVRYAHWPVFRWLENPLMRGLGVISYTFYLIHEKCLGYAGRWVGQQPVTRALVGLALTVAVATLIYFLIERRFAELRKRLHRTAANRRAAYIPA